MTRRDFLLASATVVAFRNDSIDLVERAVGRLTGNGGVAEDEDFWAQIQQSFALDRNLVNFNNGGCCPSPRIVQDVLRRQIEFSNQAPSIYMWQNLEPEIESVRRRLAKAFGCDQEEMAITRNASEALETCLFGMDLQPGDEILTTWLDYPRMITTIQQRERRNGIKLVQVRPPAVPATATMLTDAFKSEMTDKTKVILVSQVSFMNGQVFPVSDICKLGREHNIPVIVDGAHAFAQFPFDRHSLGCDYYGTSLHKWLMAPVGTGFLYVSKPKIKGLWPLFAAAEAQSGDIRKFEEIGTHPAANHNAIGEALTFHEMIGVERKAARLRFLRHRWTSRLLNEKKIQFHTNLDPKHSCGITTVGIEGIKVAELQSWLVAKHNIYTTGITHPAFEGIRVTPNVYSTLSEVDRFAEAMLVAATHGI